MQPFSAKRLARQRGITLVEAALVVSIVSLIILAALLALNTVTEQRRVTQATNDVATIRSAVAKWAAGGLLYYQPSVSGTVTTGSDQTLDKFKQIAYFLPEPIRGKAESNSVLANANPWQGDYVYITATTASPRRWKLSISDVSQELHAALKKQLEANGAESVDTPAGTTMVVVTYDE